jgi:hypothetical protein
MMQASTYAGWDFDDVWQIEEGVSYPRLRTDLRNLEVLYYDYELGDGTAESPYVITSEAQFGHIRDYADRHFRLDADLCFTSLELNSGFIFQGVLDGNGHSLTNIFMPFSTNKGTIRNLHIKDLMMDGIVMKSSSGGLVNENEGTIENCRIDGTIVITSIEYTYYNFNFGGIAARILAP